MWHACARHTVDEHFAHRDSKLRFLYDAVVGLLKRNGPLKIVPGKTGVAFQVRMRFGGVHLRKNSLGLSFLLPRRLEHPRIQKIVPYSRRAYGHHLTIASPADLDEQLADWLRESYRVGRQAELLSNRRRNLPQESDLEWSRPMDAQMSLSAGSIPVRRNPQTRKKSSWLCPKCSRSFLSPNQVHICSNRKLEDALRGKTPLAVAIFQRIAAVVRALGPVEVIPQKTRIAFQARKTFLSLRLLRNAVDCEISLSRRIEDPQFRKILSASRRLHYHQLRIDSPKQVDARARAWLREAYLSGN